MTSKNARKTVMIKGGNTHSVPDFDNLVENHPKYKRELINALNYASTMFANTDCKTFANEYARKNLDISLNCVPDWEFRSLGAICWLISSGAFIEDMKSYDTRILSLFKKYSNTKPTIKKDRAQSRTDTLLGELEGIIDDVVCMRENVKNPRDFFSVCAPFKETQIHAHFSNHLADIQDNKEGYSTLNTEYKERAVFALQTILKQLAEYKATGTTNKVVRRAAAKKIVPAKMVRNLKYKLRDDVYKLKSFAPVKIVTTDALWVFNTRNKKMMHFVAQDRVGLLVSGTTIKNFDAELSTEKTLRKPEQFLKELASAGKVAQRTLLAGIKAKAGVPTGRINEHCILVKVY